LRAKRKTSEAYLALAVSYNLVAVSIAILGHVTPLVAAFWPVWK
jgi:cation transport ATPase